MHDLLQYALGVLHIVTLVPNSRKMIVNATLSNNHTGIAVILDAANAVSSYVDPEVRSSLNTSSLKYCCCCSGCCPSYSYYASESRKQTLPLLFNVCFVDNSHLILELFLCIFSYTVRIKCFFFHIFSDYTTSIKCVNQSCLSSTFHQQ